MKSLSSLALTGSALLGLIELGAAQGKTTDELYRLALAANAHWFPVQYAKTALYFALFEAKEWKDVDPKMILGPYFSTLSGWQRNVNIAMHTTQVRSFLEGHRVELEPAPGPRAAGTMDLAERARRLAVLVECVK